MIGKEETGREERSEREERREGERVKDVMPPSLHGIYTCVRAQPYSIHAYIHSLYRKLT